MLTDNEHKAMDMTEELHNFICTNVLGYGVTRTIDGQEMSVFIHGIQNMILANSAARVYPDKYRKLGQTLIKRG